MFGEIGFVSVWLVLVSNACCFELVDTGFAIALMFGLDLRLVSFKLGGWFCVGLI